MRLVLRFFFVVCLLGLTVWARPAHASNLTTSTTQAGGADWTAAIWKTNSTSTNVFTPVAGNTYQCLSNGTAFGNNKNNTRIRSPAVVGLQTFPGNSLTVNTNTEIRFKQPGAVLNFPGVGSNPGLILNGGVLNPGDDAVFVITGKVQVAAQSYLCAGDNGGGAAKPLRGVNIAGQLIGGGTLVVMQASNIVAQQISSNSNTFSGQWIVKAGWLLGSGLNSLGTNSITLDPNYVLPLDSSIINVAGPALLEPGYDLNSAGALILTNGGVMKLHQNCVFRAVTIQGTVLSSGSHSYLELVTNFPNNFALSGSGSLTVQPYGSPPSLAPGIVTQPQSATLYTGDSTQLVATALGTAPLSYQWQKRTNSVFVNLADAGGMSGSRTNTLSFSVLMLPQAGDYRLIVTNSAGAATSQAATLTVLVADTNRPTVAVLSPPAGATVNSLTQLQVTFSKNVVGVEAQDLAINGTPASAVSGSGSNYVFAFTQPPAGNRAGQLGCRQRYNGPGGQPFRHHRGLGLYAH